VRFTPSAALSTWPRSGTPQDITLQELRIECFFSMDEATAATLRGWAAEPRQPAKRHNGYSMI
jgi:hypothetical protein